MRPKLTSMACMKALRDVREQLAEARRTVKTACRKQARPTEAT
jgi:hypothetical protein